MKSLKLQQYQHNTLSTTTKSQKTERFKSIRSKSNGHQSTFELQRSKKRCNEPKDIYLLTIKPTDKQSLCMKLKYLSNV